MKKELRNQALEHLTILRNKNISLLQDVSQDESHIIPEKFNNNLYWQAGHILTTQMSLVYRRSLIDMPLIEKNYLTYFAKGTSPNNFDANIPTFTTIVDQLKESIAVLQNDIDKYADAKYEETAFTSFGMKLNSFHDAVLAIPYHEIYHMQAINLLLKQIKLG